MAGQVRSEHGVRVIGTVTQPRIGFQMILLGPDIEGGVSVGEAREHRRAMDVWPARPAAFRPDRHGELLRIEPVPGVAPAPVIGLPGHPGRTVVADDQRIELARGLPHRCHAASRLRKPGRRDARRLRIARRPVTPVTADDDVGHVSHAVIPDIEDIELIVVLMRGGDAGARRRPVRRGDRDRAGPGAVVRFPSDVYGPAMSRGEHVELAGALRYRCDPRIVWRKAGRAAPATRAVCPSTAA